MHVRRFLEKIAGTYLAIGALSVSAFAVADVNLGHDQVGGWGHPHMYGDSWSGGPGCCPPSCPPCCPPQCCPQQECCNQPPACGIAYNPPGYFNCNNCCSSNGGFFDSLRFRADFLWWRASEDCLTLGTEEAISQFPGGSRIERSREKSPDFKYDPGFRIGLATVCPCDCWDLAVNWTHFHSKANVNGKSCLGDKPVYAGDKILANQEVVFCTEWQRHSQARPDFSHGKWTLDLDLVDLEFGRKYYVSSCFILRPHFGLRGARVDQGFRVHAEANRLDPYEDLGLGFFVSETKAKNDFLGVGPRVGVDIELALPCMCNVKLFGQAAGSLVFGKFDRHAKECFHDFSENEGYGCNFGDVNYDARATKHRISRAITDLAIGLKWEHCCNWCNRSHPITVAVAWEHHAFYNFNNFIFERLSGWDRSVCGTSRSCGGDLATQGLTVTAEIGF